jgi:hypothetical protein
MPVLGPKYREDYYEEHTNDRDPDNGKIINPIYRECRNCDQAIKKDVTALVDYYGRHYYCDARCIDEFQEGLLAQHEERLFQEYRDGGY